MRGRCSRVSANQVIAGVHGVMVLRRKVLRLASELAGVIGDAHASASHWALAMEAYSCALWITEPTHAWSVALPPSTEHAALRRLAEALRPQAERIGVPLSSCDAEHATLLIASMADVYSCDGQSALAYTGCVCGAGRKSR